MTQTFNRQNYIQTANRIPFSKLPPVLKEFDSLYRPNFSEFNKDPDLTYDINLYFTKLNKQFRVLNISKDNAQMAKKAFRKPKQNQAIQIAKAKAKAKLALALALKA